MGVGTPSDILGAVKEGIDMSIVYCLQDRVGPAWHLHGKVN